MYVCLSHPSHAVSECETLRLPTPLYTTAHPSMVTNTLSQCLLYHIHGARFKHSFALSQVVQSTQCIMKAAEHQKQQSAKHQEGNAQRIAILNKSSCCPFADSWLENEVTS